jgi:hypothetical protein
MRSFVRRLRTQSRVTSTIPEGQSKMRSEVREVRAEEQRSGGAEKQRSRGAEEQRSGGAQEQMIKGAD